MASFAAQQDRVDVALRGNLINCWFVLDNSGSMAGSKWNLAKAGIMNCIGQLTNSDFMGIILFGSEIKVVAMGARQGIDLREFGNSSANGGGTALYDAIIKAGLLSRGLHAQLHGMAAQKGVNCITYMIVLTDGEDTNSQSKVSDVHQALQLLNQTRGFKVILAGVGLNRAASTIMRGFGAVGDNDIEFRELSGMNDIKNLFEHVTVQLQATRTVLIAGANGVVAVQQKTAINLNDGSTQQNTAVMGRLAGGQEQRQLTNKVSGVSSPTSTTSSIPANSGRVKMVPSEIRDFWNKANDLNEYEIKAMEG